MIVCCFPHPQDRRVVLSIARALLRCGGARRLRQEAIVAQLVDWLFSAAGSACMRQFWRRTERSVGCGFSSASHRQLWSGDLQIAVSNPVDAFAATLAQSANETVLSEMMRSEIDGILRFICSKG
jgi:hypothetical protein